MTVLQVVSCRSIGGTELHCLDLASRLITHGIDSPIATQQDSPVWNRAQSLGIPVYPIGNTGGARFDTGFHLHDIARRAGASIIHAHLGKDFWPIVYAGWFSGGALGIVFTRHMLNAPNYLSRKFLFGRADRTIAVTKAVREVLLCSSRIDPDRVEVVSNGIELPSFDPKLVDDTALRIELGLASSRFIVGSLGKYSRESIDAFIDFEKSHPDAIYLIAGFINSAIQSYVNDRGYSDRVRFIGHRTDAPSFLKLTDILIHPAPNESFGLVVVEAMAMGVPVITSDTGGTAEIVTDGVDGITCDVTKTDVIFSALSRLAEDKELREKIAEGAAKRSRDFSVEVMVERTIDVYRHIIREREKY